MTWALILRSRATWAVVAALAIVAGLALWTAHVRDVATQRAVSEAIVRAQTAERARLEAETARDSARVAEARQRAALDSAHAVAARTRARRVIEPVRRRVERDSTSVPADTVRAVIAAADSLHAADSAVIASQAEVIVRQDSV